MHNKEYVITAYIAPVWLASLLLLLLRSHQLQLSLPASNSIDAAVPAWCFGSHTAPGVAQVLVTGGLALSYWIVPFRIDA